VELLLVFVLAAGFAVTFATLQASLAERLREGALLRTLGTQSYQLRLNQWLEFALMGALAGLIACLGTETAAWLIYTRLLDLDYDFRLTRLAILVLGGAGLIGLTGLYSGRRIVRESPLRILRETD
jgi:putative ABC transport system permease protein